jgi:hypothetical protein
VHRFGEELGNVLIDQELKSALDQDVGKSTPWDKMAWWVMFDQWRDWNTEEAIIELYLRDEAARIFTSRLVRIAGVVARIVDTRL